MQKNKHYFQTASITGPHNPFESQVFFFPHLPSNLIFFNLIIANSLNYHPIHLNFVEFQELFLYNY